MPDMDQSSMKEGTKATPSHCYWSPATGQAQETKVATEIEGWCAPSRHDPKVCGEKYRSPWRVGEAGNRGHKKQKPGRKPGLPLNVTL
jgi:hypothetical protein